MATDKDKGLIGSTTDQLKETTGLLRGQTAWHSANSDVYHNNPNCQTGNSIKPENILQGTGNKPLCGECEKLNNAGGPVGNLTNLQLFSTSAGQHFSTLRLTPSLVSGFRLLGR